MPDESKGREYMKHTAKRLLTLLALSLLVAGCAAHTGSDRATGMQMSGVQSGSATTSETTTPPPGSAGPESAPSAGAQITPPTAVQGATPVAPSAMPAAPPVAPGAPPSAGGQTDDAAALQAQLATLQEQVGSLQEQVASLTQEKAALLSTQQSMAKRLNEGAKAYVSSDLGQFQVQTARSAQLWSEHVWHLLAGGSLPADLLAPQVALRLDGDDQHPILQTTAGPKDSAWSIAMDWVRAHAAVAQSGARQVSATGQLTFLQVKDGWVQMQWQEGHLQSLHLNAPGAATP